MPATLRLEKAFWQRGVKFIAGVDEAGRGPLAGPIVAAAVILPQDFSVKGVNDSKLLTAKMRERLFIEIKRSALAIGIAKIGHRMIDRINIHQANLLAMKMAVDDLTVCPDLVLVDGARFKIKLQMQQININKGDQKSVSIAAASIIAKVTRDRIMLAYHDQYPSYGFDQHKGYATRKHRLKLEQHGRCPIHRASFMNTR